MSARRAPELGTRTMFNLLGPQSNPAGARRYMLGVFDQRWVEPVAAALLANRAISAWVVHGDDGLDELSTTGPTFVASIKGGNLTSFEITPEDAGLPRATLADLKGADPGPQRRRGCATCSMASKTPYRDIVLLNAAAALHRRRPGRHAEGSARELAAAARSTAARAKATLASSIAVVSNG